MYAIYDTLDKDQLAGLFNTYEEAGDFLGLSPDAVQKAIKRGSIMQCRYTAEKIEDGKDV